jgi:hypothetical protein
MIPPDEPPLFFTIKHIITLPEAKLIYNIVYRNTDYLIMKTPAKNDCEQLDYHPSLEKALLNTICEVISEIEGDYKKTPPLEFVNLDVFRILERIKHQ